MDGEGWRAMYRVEAEELDERGNTDTIRSVALSALPHLSGWLASVVTISLGSLNTPHPILFLALTRKV